MVRPGRKIEQARNHDAEPVQAAKHASMYRDLSGLGAADAFVKRPQSKERKPVQRAEGADHRKAVDAER